MDTTLNDKALAIGAWTKPIFKGVSANTIEDDFCGMELQENEKGVYTHNGECNFGWD